MFKKFRKLCNRRKFRQQYFWTEPSRQPAKAQDLNWLDGVKRLEFERSRTISGLQSLDHFQLEGSCKYLGGLNDIPENSTADKFSNVAETTDYANSKIVNEINSCLYKVEAIPAYKLDLLWRRGQFRKTFATSLTE